MFARGIKLSSQFLLFFALLSEGFAYYWGWYGVLNCTLAHDQAYQDEMSRVRNTCRNISKSYEDSNNGSSSFMSARESLGYMCLSKCYVEHLNQTKSDGRWDIAKFQAFEAQSNGTDGFVEKFGSLAATCDQLAVERLQTEGGYDKNLCTYYDMIDYCIFLEKRKVRKELNELACLST